MPHSKRSTFHDAEQRLSAADAVMRELIQTHGPCRLTPNDDAFYVLCDSIISQQLSVKASATILRRFCALFPNDAPTPELVYSCPAEQLRAAGCSNAKVNYLKDLARHFLEGLLRPETFPTLDDRALIATLTRVKGIGTWTAEMYCIFALNRPDILATDDLGLRKAIKNLYGFADLPKAQETLEIGEQWRPFRSVASWYLWRSLDNAPKATQ
jgi:DNA-3-methyladenine glycosylase II